MTAPAFRHRLPLPLLAVVGVLPALLLGAIGFRAIRGETQLAALEARENAQTQAGLILRAVEGFLGNPSLPSAADVQAFEASPADPEADPAVRAARATDAVAALFAADDRTYPALAPQLPPALGLDAQAILTPPEVALWAETLRAEDASGPSFAAPTSRPQWETLLNAATGSDLEGTARFHLGRAFLAEGLTGDAAREWRVLVDSPSRLVGETGFPLDVLALRGLIQLAEVDPTASPAPPGPDWFDLLAYRLLIRWHLPAELLAEWEPARARGAKRWRQLASRHEAARSRFLSLEPRPDFHAATPPAPGWVRVGEEPEPGHFLTVHPVDGGSWWLLRSRESLGAGVRQRVDQVRLPEHLGGSVSLAGRELIEAEPGAMDVALAVAKATGPADLAVRIHLTRPELLDARRRVRVWGFAALILLAATTAVAGFLVALRAYDRQRRLAEMQSDFVASVSHELRAPVAAVQLLTEELVDLPGEEPARRGEYLQFILRETRRLGLLIENILRHSRLERGRNPLDLVPVNLAEVAELSVASLRPTAGERGVGIESFLPEHPVLARADPQAIQQVLVNLLDNALKHSPPGGTTRLGLETAGGPCPTARLWVADDGPGIPPADHDRIFESFVRRGSELRRETAGVGLGLAIVRRLVQAHGGSVRVDSQPGSGARFIVELPLAGPGCSAVPTAAIPAPEA